MILPSFLAFRKLRVSTGRSPLWVTLSTLFAFALLTCHTAIPSWRICWSGVSPVTQRRCCCFKSLKRRDICRRRFRRWRLVNALGALRQLLLRGRWLPHLWSRIEVWHPKRLLPRWLEKPLAENRREVHFWSEVQRENDNHCASKEGGVPNHKFWTIAFRLGQRQAYRLWERRKITLRRSKILYSFKYSLLFISVPYLLFWVSIYIIYNYTLYTRDPV